MCYLPPPHRQCWRPSGPRAQIWSAALWSSPLAGLAAADHPGGAADQGLALPDPVCAQGLPETAPDHCCYLPEIQNRSSLEFSRLLFPLLPTSLSVTTRGYWLLGDIKYQLHAGLGETQTTRLTIVGSRPLISFSRQTSSLFINWVIHSTNFSLILFETLSFFNGLRYLFFDSMLSGLRTFRFENSIIG